MFFFVAFLGVGTGAAADVIPSGVLESFKRRYLKEEKGIEESEGGVEKRIACFKELWRDKTNEIVRALKVWNVPESAAEDWRAGNYGAVEEFFVKESGKGRERAAEAAYSLGNVRVVRFRFDEAFACYQKALELAPMNTFYLYQYGRVFYALGKYEEAKNCYESLLHLSRQIYGAKHPQVAAALNSLGDVRAALGENTGAMECYERSLSLSEELYGEKHGDVAAALTRLGDLWCVLGETGRAGECYEKGYAISCHLFGADHPRSEAIKEKLARVSSSCLSVSGVRGGPPVRPGWPR